MRPNGPGTLPRPIYRVETQHFATENLTRSKTCLAAIETLTCQLCEGSTQESPIPHERQMPTGTRAARMDLEARDHGLQFAVHEIDAGRCRVCSGFLLLWRWKRIGDARRCRGGACRCRLYLIAPGLLPFLWAASRYC